MENSTLLIDKINSLGKSRTPFILFVDFLGKQGQLYLINELEKANITLAFPTFKTNTAAASNIPISVEKKPLNFPAYKQKFELVQQHLHYGNSYLTNLTCQTDIDTKASLDDIYANANAKYKIKYKDEWVCFSPETFIKIDHGIIRSFPMKGTIDAAIPNAAEIILVDKKELAEHYTIVDLIRNDLNMVASEVIVKRFRYIDRIETSSKTLLQVSSEIEGKLPDNFHEHLGDLLFSLLPAGSISGAPKHKTLSIIAEAEQYDRGYYTGTAFYFDGKNVDSCVLIRFIEQQKKDDEIRMVYKSGGGITIHSNAALEYQELIDKIYVPII